MNRQKLIEQIQAKKSCLCIGLDTDIHRIPSQFKSSSDPVFEFNKAIIDATHDLCVAYKPNIAFYESMGISGWKSLEKTLDYIPDDIFTIADAKRGDILNTSTMYAKTYFEYMDFDAVTVAPYMGKDSVTPFLEFTDKWVIVLGLTSNEGSADFQQLQLNSGEILYEKVIKTVQQWGNPDNLMFVIGATRHVMLADIRSIAPDHFFLIPGVGAQGGDVEQVMLNGRNNDVGMLINSSRNIIYAGSGHDFQEMARSSALSIQHTMAGYIGI